MSHISEVLVDPVGNLIADERIPPTIPRTGPKVEAAYDGLEFAKADRVGKRDGAELAPLDNPLAAFVLAHDD